MIPINTEDMKGAKVIVKNNRLYDTQTGKYNREIEEWPASDLQEQQSLLQLADRRAETWFRIAMAGWASAIVLGALLIWMTFIWP